MSVRIYHLDRGYTICQWLCSKHLQGAKDAGWEVKQEDEPTHKLRCDHRNRGRCEEDTDDEKEGDRQQQG